MTTHEHEISACRGIRPVVTATLRRQWRLSRVGQLSPSPFVRVIHHGVSQLHSVAARRRLGVLAAATALTVCATGCAGTGTPPPVGSTAAATTGTGVAPYVDVTLAATPLTEMATATGVADVVFAFALATDGRCEPSWGGIRAVDDPAIAGRISAFRDQGGRVTVATGGAAGDYLENACTSADDLAR